MKQKISALIAFTLLVIFPVAAMSEVKVTLKNGREFIADSCRTVKDRLVCEKMGGTFEFEKQEILNIKEITIQRQDMDERPTQETPPQGTEPDDKEGKISDGETQNASVEDTKKPSAPSSAENIRLDSITRRKLELRAEREGLLREREQLQQEIKNADAYLTKEKFDELQKKADALDSRIKNFSSELKALNEEEAGILKGLQQTP